MSKILSLLTSLALLDACDAIANRQMADIDNKVAADAVAQYDIAMRSGSAMDRCVHAGLVAAAYIQAKDEQSYSRWKATERADCALAGLPPQR